MGVDVLESNLDSIRTMSVGGASWRTSGSVIESMTVDELFALREQMREVLSIKLNTKKAALERRLQSLNQLSNNNETTKPRRS